MKLYPWPPHPPPNGQRDLRDIFPREIGKMSPGYYQPTHVMIERMSQKRYMTVIACFQVKYLPRKKVWIFCVWPLKRGQLFGLGAPSTGQGIERMQWETTCTYEKFKKKLPFLLKLAEVIGRARKYP